MAPRSVVLTALTLLLAIACGPPTTGSDEAAGRGGPPPSAGAPVLPVGRPSLDPALVDAIETRQRFGLRADEQWVRAVAEHPDAVIDDTWGIPLLPDELADLRSRRWPHDLLLQVRRYGLRVPDEFATAYHDLTSSGVTALFTANLDEHREGLRDLPLAGPVQLRLAEWSRSELLARLEIVEASREWLESIGVTWSEADVAELENRVSLRYESLRDLDAEIMEHFAGSRWLLLRWEGPTGWPGPHADLVVRTLDARGKPLSNVMCVLVAVEPEMTEWVGRRTFGSGAAGVCEMDDLPAVRYRLALHEWRDDAHSTTPYVEVEVDLPPTGRELAIRKPAS